MSEPKQKRQRISFACQYCRKRKIGCDKIKPKCSICQRLGLSCIYTQTNWAKEQKELEVKEGERLVQQELKRLEALSERLENNEDIRIDFYANYNSLSNKTSSHEDHKPLNLTSIFKKDVYFSFFFSYMALTLRLNSDLFEQHWKSKHADGASKWLILLDTKNEDADMKDFIKQIVSDRAQLSRMNFVPVWRLHEKTECDKFKSLERKVDLLLPKTKKAIDDYWEFYITYIWPLRSFVNKEQFKDKLDNLLSYDPVTGQPSLTLRSYEDLPILSIFLIILRFVSCAIHLTDNWNSLKDHPIPIKAITIAKYAISLCPQRNISMEILQFQMLLRSYFRDAPEDGDGASSSQSQNTFGLIVSSALSLGLNQDYDGIDLDFRRNFWYSLMSFNTRSVIVSGVFNLIPNEKLYNIKPPVINEDEDDNFIKTQKEEILKQLNLQKIYYQISELMNNVNDKTSLNELMKLVEQSKNYIKINYNLKNTISLKGLIPNSIPHKSNGLRNIKILSWNIIQCMMEHQIYTSIHTHFETNTHLNLQLYEKFYLLMLESTREIADLTSAYLLGHFDGFIDQNHRFEILPLIRLALVRYFTCATNNLLRLYHMLDLMKTSIYKNGDLTNEIIENLINSIIEPEELLLSLTKKVLCKLYYTGIKTFSCYKYALATLKTYRFQTMTKIINFLETENGDIDLNKYRKHEVLKNLQNEASTLGMYKEWTKFEDSIINLNNTNMFTKVSIQFIQKCISIFQSPYVYCPDFLRLIRASPPDPLSLAHSDLVLNVIKGRKAKEYYEEYKTFEPMTGLVFDDEFFNEVFNFNLNFMSDQESDKLSDLGRFFIE